MKPNNVLESPKVNHPPQAGAPAAQIGEASGKPAAFRPKNPFIESGERSLNWLHEKGKIISTKTTKLTLTDKLLDGDG